jgi:hypothetical protein
MAVPEDTHRHPLLTLVLCCTVLPYDAVMFWSALSLLQLFGALGGLVVELLGALGGLVVHRAGCVLIRFSWLIVHNSGSPPMRFLLHLGSLLCPEECALCVYPILMVVILDATRVCGTSLVSKINLHFIKEFRPRVRLWEDIHHRKRAPKRFKKKKKRSLGGWIVKGIACGYLIPLLLEGTGNHGIMKCVIKATSTTDMLLRRIAGHIKAPVEDFYVLHHSKKIESGKMIEDYNIGMGDSVVVNWRIKGGNPNVAERTAQRTQKSRREKKQRDNELEQQNKQNKRQRKSREKQNEPKKQKRTVSVGFEQGEFQSAKQKKRTMLKFEEKMKSLKHNHCMCCRCVGISLKMAKKLPGICKNCEKLPADEALTQRLLPIWKNEQGEVQYKVPKELSELTDAEKMLIQMVSPFVPLHHIKNGTFGLKGHVCSFPQRLETVCETFPRLPSDVTVVKMIQTYQEEVSGAMGQRTFAVRRYKVIAALKWLQKYNVLYKDIKIEEGNLDWMSGVDETELIPCFESVTNSRRQVRRIDFALFV